MQKLAKIFKYPNIQTTIAQKLFKIEKRSFFCWNRERKTFLMIYLRRRFSQGGAKQRERERNIQCEIVRLKFSGTIFSFFIAVAPLLLTLQNSFRSHLKGNFMTLIGKKKKKKKYVRKVVY